MSEPKVIQDPGEVPLVLHSRPEGPLSERSFLRRALALAELAMISYNDEAEAARAAAAIGFPEIKMFDHDGAQAFEFSNEHDCVVACRGTEPSEWNDVQADARVALAVVGTLGRVHSGFNREADDLWPFLESTLSHNQRMLWFCGHSLGGAIATIVAARCKLSVNMNDPIELHTFGSPRVGCRRYARHAAVKHFRWVHNNDIVTRLPAIWMGYRHGGKEIYLDRRGRISKLRGVLRSRDRLKGLLAGMLKWKLDFLSDHSIHLYAQHIAHAAEKEG